MTSGIEFNKSYTSSYIILPLNKLNGLTVISSNKELDAKINAKQNIPNLKELKQADSDGNGILTLEELKSCKNKTEFMTTLERAMEKFNSNPYKDYSKNLFKWT